MPGAYDDVLIRMYQRQSLEHLPEHLGTTYGIEVEKLTTLDVGVIKVDRADGPPWVARVFAAARPPACTDGDAAVLRHVAAHDIPAERLAGGAPISTLDGQQVLVTTFLERAPKAKRDPEVYRQIGSLLGRLHAIPLPAKRSAAHRPAGALHHHAEGGRRAELDAAVAWLDQIEERVATADRKHVEKLRTALAEADDGEGLATSVIHPDPVPKNLVRTGPGEFAYVDWAGAGVGPRALSLSWLLSTKASAPGVAQGYAEHVTLTDEEWERLPSLIAGRGLIGLCFRLGLGPQQAKALAGRLSTLQREARAIVDAARAATPSPS
jgi:Ser/Thr protein kinase RdoA (MazF antagonist)